ncbi:MAG TPA: hypothetical protein VF698_01415, partial [Thermoanaerobaculia bacterium]
MNNGNGVIWREKQILLIVLGLLLIANTIFFFTYRVQFEERLRALDERLAASEQTLQSARNERLAAERQFASYRQVQKDVQEIYDRRWATQAERLTLMIGEVKRLAVASNLVPRTYAFTKSEPISVDNDRSAAGRPRGRGTLNANEVSITFTVSGTYEQVRRLINLLELSEQFVIVDQIGLTTSAEGALTVNLGVKTLFRTGGPAP